MERVGVRELRQNLSVYLRRIERGESLEVTDRGHAVAVLAPLRPADPLDRLVAAGRATRPDRDLLDVRPERRSKKVPLSRVLQEMRRDER